MELKSVCNPDLSFSNYTARDISLKLRKWMTTYSFSFVIRYHVDVIFTMHTELEAKFGCVVLAKDGFSWLCHLACIKVLLYIYLLSLVQFIKHQGNLNQHMWGIPIMLAVFCKTAVFQQDRPISSPRFLDMIYFSSLPHSTQVVFFCSHSIACFFYFSS